MLLLLGLLSSASRGAESESYRLTARWQAAGAAAPNVVEPGRYQSASPVTFDSPGETTAGFDFTRTFGSSDTLVVTVRDIGGGHPPPPGYLVTLRLSPEMSFTPLGTPPELLKTLPIDAFGNAAFTIYFVAPSLAAGSASVTIIAPGAVFEKNPIVGTIVAVVEQPTVAFDGATAEVLSNVTFTARTQPPSLDGLIRWTFTRKDGAPFDVLLAEPLTAGKIVVQLASDGEYTLKAACRPSDPGRTVDLVVKKKKVDFVLVTPDPAFLFPGQEITLTSIGYQYVKGQPQMPPDPKIDPESTDPRDVETLSHYKKLGPAASAWTFSQEPDGEGPRPKLEVVGAKVGPSVVLRAKAGGVLRPGIVATPKEGLPDPHTELLVPYVGRISFVHQGTDIEASHFVGLVSKVKRPDDLDEDTAIFADQEIPGLGFPRKQAGILVQIEPKDDPKVKDQLEKRKSRLFAGTFDVEDQDPEGFRQRKPGEPKFADSDNQAEPKSGALMESVVAIDPATNTALFDLGSSAFPGDNYRVIAGFEERHVSSDVLRAEAGDAANRSRLVRTAPDGEVTEPDTNAVPDELDLGNKKLPAARQKPGYRSSPRLTVWRNVHVEVDKMTVDRAVGPRFPGQVVKVEGADVTIDFEAPLPADLESLKEGKLYVPAEHDKKPVNVRDIGGISPDRKRAVVTLDGTPPAGKPKCVLRDDDDLELLDGTIEELLDRTPFSRSVYASSNVLAHAFLRPRFDGAAEPKNTNNEELPFRANLAELAADNGLKRLLADGKWQSSGQNRNRDYWTAYLRLAYQPDSARDLDPESERSAAVAALPDVEFGGSLLFVETLGEIVNRKMSRPRFSTLAKAAAQSVAITLGLTIDNGAPGTRLMSPKEQLGTPLGEKPLTGVEKRTLRKFDPKRVRRAVEAP